MKVSDLVIGCLWSHSDEVGIVTITGRYRRGSHLKDRWAIVYWFRSKKREQLNQKYLKVVNESR